MYGFVLAKHEHKRCMSEVGSAIIDYNQRELLLQILACRIERIIDFVSIGSAGNVIKTNFFCSA